MHLEMISYTVVTVLLLLNSDTKVLNWGLSVWAAALLTLAQ